MKKVYIKKLAGAGVLSIGLVFGMAGFAGATTGTIETTGPDSNNEIRHNTRVNLEVRNNNDINAANTNTQRGDSGDARVRYNTTGGNATTGSAMNDNSVDAWIEVDNSQAASGMGEALAGSSAGADSATIENTGPNSNNEVVYRSRTNVQMNNTNNVSISNNVQQTASSGDAVVRYNTTGGDATSGDATNTSSSVFTVSVTN